MGIFQHFIDFKFIEDLAVLVENRKISIAASLHNPKNSCADHLDKWRIFMKLRIQILLVHGRSHLAIQLHVYLMSQAFGINYIAFHWKALAFCNRTILCQEKEMSGLFLRQSHIPPRLFKAERQPLRWVVFKAFFSYLHVSSMPTCSKALCSQMHFLKSVSFYTLRKGKMSLLLYILFFWKVGVILITTVILEIWQPPTRFKVPGVRPSNLNSIYSPRLANSSFSPFEN